MTVPDAGGGSDAPGDDRAAALAAALARVRERIDDAARAAGRDPAGIELLAVTKTWPASDAAHLVDLGLCCFGENKEQEGAAKAAALAELRPGTTVAWRVVGQLQRRKSRAVVRWADAVDSVDSPRLAASLDAAASSAIDAGERTGPLPVLLQVSLDGDPDRGGVRREELAALADDVGEAAGLRLDGLMAVLPRDVEPGRGFADLAEIAAGLRAGHPDATTLSAGMSTDLADAIEHGSTCVRVGTALLGGR